MRRTPRQQEAAKMKDKFYAVVAGTVNHTQANLSPSLVPKMTTHS